MRAKIRLEPSVHRPDLGDCWIWTGFVMDNGYGKVKFERQGQLVHRVTYRLLVGEIPAGLELDHLCRRTDCCHPTHTEAVTHLVNMRRGEPLSRTHCKRRGHPLSGDNLAIRIHRDGYECRECRACSRIRALASYYRRQQAAA